MVYDIEINNESYIARTNKGCPLTIQDELTLDAEINNLYNVPNHIIYDLIRYLKAKHDINDVEVFNNGFELDITLDKDYKVLFDYRTNIVLAEYTNLQNIMQSIKDYFTTSVDTSHELVC